MIKIDKVSKKFTKNINKKETIDFYADKDLNFEIKDGEILGLLGPNGAGKTTLLRMMAGIMTPTSGKISYDDLEFPKDSVEIKKKIAFLSGNTKLYKDISPYEFLILCGSYYEIDKEVLERKIEEIAKRFKLKNFLHQRIENLSTGQMQRVNVARCIIHDPQIYILDEATSGLDIISSKVILDFIKEEQEKGKTIIYSTHYMEEAENICDRVILIHKGKIVSEGTPQEIIAKTETTNLRDAFFKIIKEVPNE